MTPTKITKKYSTKKKIFGLLSFFLTFFPMATYVMVAFLDGDVQTTEKFTLGITVTIALILCMINLLMKYHIRSTLWILILGVYICLDNIMPLLLIVAICTIVDEFILHPLYKKYCQLTTINKEIDKRGSTNSYDATN